MHSNGIKGSSGKPLREQQAASLALLKSVQGTTSSSPISQSPSLLDFLTEKVSISTEAKDKLNAEREWMKFARIASNLNEPFNAEKVKTIKDQLSSQGVSGYLQNLNPAQLASSVLKGFWQ